MTDKNNPIGLEMRREHAEDLLLIESYGDGGFRAMGRRFEGAVLVAPDGIWPLDADAEGEISLEAVKKHIDADALDFMLVGTGETMTLPSRALRHQLDALALAYDVMDTGAAARTFNVLRIEGRRIVALLKAV